MLAPVQLGSFRQFLHDLQLKDASLSKAIEDHLQSELERARDYNNGYSCKGLADSKTWVRHNEDLHFLVDSLLRQIYDDKSVLSLCDGDILIHAGRGADSNHLHAHARWLLLFKVAYAPAPLKSLVR